MLIILSEDSADSPWVEREVVRARTREDKTGDAIPSPITLDDAVFESDAVWATDIVDSCQIGDFRGSDTDYSKYKAAFDRVLRDLKESVEGDSEGAAAATAE